MNEWKCGSFPPAMFDYCPVLCNIPTRHPLSVLRNLTDRFILPLQVKIRTQVKSFFSESDGSIRLNVWFVMILFPLNNS